MGTFFLYFLPAGMCAALLFVILFLFVIEGVKWEYYVLAILFFVPLALAPGLNFIVFYLWFKILFDYLSQRYKVVNGFIIRVY